MEFPWRSWNFESRGGFLGGFQSSACAGCGGQTILLHKPLLCLGLPCLAPDKIVAYQRGPVERVASQYAVRDPVNLIADDRFTELLGRERQGEEHVAAQLVRRGANDARDKLISHL